MKGGILLSIYISIQLVMADTWFELRLQHFNNPSGRESDGDCCDFPCSDPCDPIITVCFDKPDTGECSHSIRHTGHYHKNTFDFGSTFENGARNPMTVKFTEPWPSTIYLTVRVDDRDALNANDWMGTLRKTYTSSAAPSAADAMWHSLQFVFNYQTITAQARVYCDTHFYGDDCMTYCKAQDSDEKGHYTCAADGSIVCHEDYYGPECKTYCEPAKNSTEHYYCNAMGRLVCESGWRGERCSGDVDECEIPDHNPCSPNGECINTNGSYTCNCTKSFKGVHCEEPRLFCDDLPCSNNSVCNNTVGGFMCICDANWTGVLCNEAVTPCTSSPCENDGVCNVTGTSFTCDCIGPWKGRTCEKEVIVLLNDTKVLFLRGHLPESQWDDLTLGIRHLLRDLLHITEVAIETTITYPSELQTKVEIFVESRDPNVVDSLDKILVLPEEEVKVSLILPLSETQEVIQSPLAQKPDPWVKKHWYVVLAGVIVIMAITAAVVVIMYLFKKRRRDQEEKSGFDHPRACGRDSLPDAAIGFDNSLYFEAKSPDKVRGLPTIPGSP